MSINLKVLLEQVLNEVGDLDKISPYNFIKSNSNEYRFSTDDGLSIKVSFVEYDNETQEYLKLKDKTYNISYSVEGDESQFKKESYSYLIKILKTIFDIIVKYLNDNKEINNLTLFAGNKNKDKFLSQTDSQKEKLYKIIFLKNRNKLNGDWWYRDLEAFENYNGILIYKK